MDPALVMSSGINTAGNISEQIAVEYYIVNGAVDAPRTVNMFLVIYSLGGGESPREGIPFGETFHLDCVLN